MLYCSKQMYGHGNMSKILKSNRTVAIIDRGGRGAALAFAYSKSRHVKQILVIPGSGLIQQICKKKVLIFPNIEITDKKGIVSLCKEYFVDLIDVAQDDAVAVGVVDALTKAGFNVNGPTKKAGKIEWSKAFSRRLMKHAGVSQPEFRVFNNYSDGSKYLDRQIDQPWFVKADGLVRGKGALAAANNKEAKLKIKDLARLGIAGKTYLLEKWLKNEENNAEEFSAFAICDGKTFKILGYAQDHKRVFDGDKGENTGGIGVCSSPLVITKSIRNQVEEIYRKVLKELSYNKTPYSGVLYLGGILVGKKVNVIEFNARWGDPEAEAIVPSIRNDFYEISSAVANNDLKNLKISVDNKKRVVVTGCAKGYPNDFGSVMGKEVKGLEKVLLLKDILIFGASIIELDGKVYVDGGRLFHIVAIGKDIVDAREKAYRAMKMVSVDGGNLHYRTDIGWRDVQRLREKSF